MIEVKVEIVNDIVNIDGKSGGTVGDIIEELATLNASVINEICRKSPIFDAFALWSVIEKRTREHLNEFQEEQDNV